MLKENTLHFIWQHKGKSTFLNEGKLPIAKYSVRVSLGSYALPMTSLSAQCALMLFKSPQIQSRPTVVGVHVKVCPLFALIILCLDRCFSSWFFTFYARPSVQTKAISRWKNQFGWVPTCRSEWVVASGKTRRKNIYPSWLLWLQIMGILWHEYQQWGLIV